MPLTYRIKRLLGLLVTNGQSIRWVTQGVTLSRLWSGRVGSTKHCLDIGCGGGTYGIEHFLKKGARTSLYDYDTGLVELTRRQVREEGLDALADIGQASATQLPFADKIYDCLQCIEVLEHLEDPVAAVREIFRVAKPGAVFVASTPHLPEWFDNAGHVVDGYTRASLSELLEKGGWKVEQVEVCMLIVTRLIIAAMNLLKVPLPLNPVAALENLVPVALRPYLLPYDVVVLARRPE